jgi:hypothetical protein
MSIAGELVRWPLRRIERVVDGEPATVTLCGGSHANAIMPTKSVAT